MKNTSVGSQAALSIVQGCLVASIQSDLYDDLLMKIRRDILDRIQAKTVQGVIFDMSVVRVMDTYIFNHLADTAKMIRLLGVEALFVGFRPGVVSALVDLNIDTRAVRSFRSMDDVFDYFVASTQREDDTIDEEDEPVNPEVDEEELSKGSLQDVDDE